MDSLGFLLVIVDPTAAAHPCIRKAAVIAAGFHARVELLICESQPRTREQPGAPQAFLEGLAAPLRAAGIAVAMTVITANPVHRGMLTRIGQVRPDLVLKDTHYHSVIRRTLVTNTDWHLIRDCPAPLLLVKPRDWPHGPMQVACAVDPGHADDKPWSLDHEIIGTMEYLSTGLPLAMSVVNAFSLVDDVIQAGATGAAEAVVIGVSPLDAARKNQLATLRKLAVGHRLDASQFHLVEGAALEALPKFIERDRIDVLIMGAVARGAFFNHFIGSTAESVLDHLSCDVLIVKPAQLMRQMWEASRG